MKFLSIPVERLFSSSGYIVRPHRCRISEENLEKTVKLKSNSFLIKNPYENLKKNDTQE